jgi:uncharacterized protein YeaO (DUF488 family)
VAVARVHDEVGRDPSPRVLVDRLWPRGLSRADAPFEAWTREVAPGSDLRKWYGHAPDRFEEFERRHRHEPTTSPSGEALDTLQARAGAKPPVLLTATKDLAHSQARILGEAMAGG